MKVTLSKSRTLDGFTFSEGEHEVNDLTGQKLLENFPAVCKLWTAPKPKPVAKPVAKPKPAAVKAPAKPKAKAKAKAKPKPKSRSMFTKKSS